MSTINGAMGDTFATLLADIPEEVVESWHQMGHIRSRVSNSLYPKKFHGMDVREKIWIFP